MKLIILAVVAVAVGADHGRFRSTQPTPQNSYYGAPEDLTRADLGGSNFEREVVEVVPIIKDERVMEDDGNYNFEIETGDGIKMSQEGTPDGPEGAVVKTGEYSYTAPDGTFIELSFVADENGFQPQGDHLPEIPQFVLDQIAKAAEEDAAAARAETRDFRVEANGQGSSQSYGQP